MNDEKKITVIIPTKNRPKLLERSVSCFENKSKDIDLIVVDDGSETRNAQKNLDIVKNKGKYIYQEQSKGACFARNKGIEDAKTSYIWFFDDDDFVEQETIIDMLKYLENKAARKNAILLPMTTVFQGVKISTIIPITTKNNFETYRDIGHQVNTSCLIIKKQLINKIGKWDSNLVAGQDTDLFLRISKESMFYCLPTQPVKVYISHKDRITLNSKNQHKGKIQFYSKHKNDLSFKRKFYYLITYITFISYWKKYIDTMMYKYKVKKTNNIKNI